MKKKKIMQVFFYWGGGKLVSVTIHLQGKRFENVAQGFRVEDTVGH